MTENREYTEIINIIENKRWDKLKYSLADMHAAEIVDIIRILDNDKNKSILLDYYLPKKLRMFFQS